MSEYVAANKDLLSAIYRLAPKYSLKPISDVINEIRWEGHSEKQVTIYLLNTLYFGLNQDLWPDA